MTSSEVPGRRPERRAAGRSAPPPGYPKDKEQYADPENWTYPLNTAVRARLARKYFDDERNRSKYDEEERKYIDARINAALHDFGFATVSTEGDATTEQRFRKTGAEIPLDALENATREELLSHFLGRPRLERAKAIANSLVTIDSYGEFRIKARVKDYLVEVNVQKRIIRHDCPDWKNWSTQKMMCKHIGKIFLMLDEKISAPILRQIYRERESWSFSSVSA